MKNLRSSRQLIKVWHRREKATIDHLVNGSGPAKGGPDGRTSHSALTASGLIVEEQVRKAWRPCGVGLPIF